MPSPDAAFIARYIDEASDAHYSVLFTPPARRDAVAAVFAFHCAMRDLLTVQPDVAPTKVSWWHEELARIRRGEGVHPLSKKLMGVNDAALFDAMDALLHGAVMDLNHVDVDDDSLDQYLRLRGGALHEALGAITGVHVAPADQALLARMQSIPSILSEARDPRFADRPSARLALTDGGDDQRLEATLCTLHGDAWRQLAGRPLPGVSSAVCLALGRLAWPLIIATPYGKAPPEPAPWRKLWSAWRAARRHQSQGTAT